MFEVLNSDNVVVYKSNNINLAKMQAQRMREELAEQFTVWEIKQVWTTQTLDEALKS